MWVWQCENLAHEYHSLDGAIEGMRGHRGEFNDMLPEHLHMSCQMPHEIHGVEAPCQWHEGCNIPFDPTVSLDQKSELNRLGCVLV